MNYFTFESLGATLHAVVYLPSVQSKSPGVLLFHGLSNSRHIDPLIQDTAEELQRRGFATMQFDFYGSGESDGWFHEKTFSILEQNGRDALKIFREVPFVEGSKVGLWGRSGGGAPIATLLAPEVSCIVLVSPGFRMPKTFGPWMEAPDADGYVPMSSRYPHQSIKGYWKLAPRFVEELAILESRLPEVARQSRNALVIQGDADRTIPDWRDSQQLLECFQESRQFLLVHGADHRYAGKKDEIVGQTADWYSKFLI